MERASSNGVSRREAIGRVARVGAGTLAALTSGVAVARGDDQIGGVTPAAPRPDPAFPQPPTWETELKELAPDVYAYIQAGGPGRDNASVANAGVIVGDRGVAVIDTLTAPMHARAFIAAIRRVTDKPFTQVFLTHHHGDHINGTQYFDGAEVISHPYCRDEIVKVAQAGGPAFWPKREGWADGTEPRRIVPPDNNVRRQDDVSLRPDGPRAVADGAGAHLRRHRRVPAAAQDPVRRRHRVSSTSRRGARTRTRADGSRSADTIDRMDVRTIVAGHGPLGGKAELADMRDYLVRLKREARRRYDAEDDRRRGRRRHPDGEVRQLDRPGADRAGRAASLRRVRGHADAGRQRRRHPRATNEYNAARRASSR